MTFTVFLPNALGFFIFASEGCCKGHKALKQHFDNFYLSGMYKKVARKLSLITFME